MRKILAADIGATNSRFAYFDVDINGELSLNNVRWLRTDDSSSFGGLLADLKSGGFPLDPAEADISVIAVAGPIERGTRSSPPFISWNIDIANAEQDYGIKQIYLINDFVAQAYACRSRLGETAGLIKPGEIVKDAVAAVIGAGTALGKAVLVSDEDGRFLAIPSEGGHASFPFESIEENAFQQFLIKKLGDSYITWNKVVSGRGLSYIHEFLTGEEAAPEEIISRIVPDTETLAWASRFYGRACRDFALETLALGGVYISGGVAARTPELVTHRAFKDEFNRSDTLSEILVRIPVYLIREQNAGLWGCGVMGLQKLK